MPWKESNIVNERMKFVYRLEDGEKMSDLCKEFGISRPTGYKILNRFKDHGPQGLYDFSKKPKNYGNAIPDHIRQRLYSLKEKYKKWGAPKIQEKYREKYEGKPPAISTIHSYFEKKGLVKKRKKRSKYRAEGLNLRHANDPNDLWCCDYKGQFKLQNKCLCYPLTVTDQVSRYILGIEALECIETNSAIEIFKNVFQEYGVPGAIRSDNGTPFASVSLFGLSRLNIMWLKQGIKLERIRPGNPQENGRHERMHKSLKFEAINPVGKNLLHQQEQFDRFRAEFNNDRPHEGLKMKTPSSVFTKSATKFNEKPDYGYELQETRKVAQGGTFRVQGAHIFIGRALAGEHVGLEQIEEEIYAVNFMDYSLGFFDTIEYKFTQGDNPFLIQGAL